MYLTKEEEAILGWEYGEAAQIAMSVLVKLGEMYGADRMVEVQHVHIDAVSYATIYDSDLYFCEKLASAGTRYSERLRDRLRGLAGATHTGGGC